MPMTRHERCLAAIHGQPVDRAPTYIPGIACDVASNILGRPVNTGTGSLHYAEVCSWLKGDSGHTEFEAKLFEDLAALFRALDIDVYRMPWRERSKPTRQLDEFTFLFGDPNGAHSICAYNPDSADFGPIKIVSSSSVPYADTVKQRIEAREREVAAGALAKATISGEHKKLCARYGKEFFVVGNGGGIGLGMGEESLIFLASEPEWAARDVLLQARNAVAFGQALHREGCPGVMIAGGDLAGQDGPLYSPAAFRQVMLPALALAMKELKKLDVHYVFRTDGNLWSISDMLFKEAACPGYGEVDRDAGMTVGALRKKYPKLVLWGNLSSARLAWESAAWIRDDARKTIGESGGTGYFHGPSNAIMKGTPAKNVEAMFSL